MGATKRSGMKRSIQVGLLCGVGAFCALTWLRPRPTPSAIPWARPTTRHAYLSARVPTVTGRVTLARLGQIVNRSVGVTVSIDFRTIEAAGVEESTEIALDLRDVTVDQLLRAAIDRFGGGAVGLGYRCEENLILITTLEDLDKRARVARLYDVRDIVETVAKDERALRALRRKVGVQQRAPADTDESLEWDSLSMVRVGIHMALDPDTWDGPSDRISMIGGLFVIATTPERHDRLTRFLAELRAALAKAP
jgi:hypothetical protein